MENYQENTVNVTEDKRIAEMRKSMEERGIYSQDDINSICNLYSEYYRECDEIANDCMEEGYPSRGSNYELRCESAWAYYEEELDYIDSKYPELAEEMDEEEYDDEYYEEEYNSECDEAEL